MKRFRRSDHVESALLSGFTSGALAGAGVFVWWLPLSLLLFFWGLFRKYAFYAVVTASVVGFSFAFYCSKNFEARSKLISESNYCYGTFRLCLNDARQSKVKNIGQPSMLNARLLGYRLSGTGNWSECDYKVMVRLPQGMEVPEYGTVISGYGNISDSNDPGFSNYLKSRNIVKCIYLKNAENVGAKPCLMGYILSIRDKIAARALTYVNNDISRNLAAALFFGITGGFSNDLRNVYVDTGTVHIFSVSGMHVAVLAFFLFLIFRVFGMRYGYLLTLLITGFYVVSTGASAPAVRAYFMLCIWSASRIWLMWMPPFSVFCWASFFLLLFDPLLVLDIGARYSIVITGVLVAVSSMFTVYKKQNHLRRKYLVPGGKVDRPTFLSVNLSKMKKALYICIAAFCGGLAISLHHNGQFLLFSIPVNLLLAPFMSIFYLLLGTSVFIPSTGLLLSWAFQFLHYFCSFVAEWSRNLPAAAPGGVEMWLYIALLFVGLRCRGLVRVSAYILLASLVVRWILLPYGMPYEVWLYNHIKRPCSIMLIDSAKNSAVVIDPVSGAAASDMVRHLQRRGVTKVESVIFSRNSVATARGLRTLSRRIPVEQVVVPEIKRHEKWKNFRRYLEDCGVGKDIKMAENHKKVKIIRQKGVVTLEYFKRCAKLKDVLILKDESDGRQFEIKPHGYESAVNFMPYSGHERIYRYEFGK